MRNNTKNKITIITEWVEVQGEISIGLEKVGVEATRDLVDKGIGIIIITQMKGEIKVGGGNHEDMETGTEAQGESLTKTNPGEILTGNNTPEIKGQDFIMGNDRGKGDQQVNTNKVVGIGTRGVEVVHRMKEGVNTDEVHNKETTLIDIDRETRIGGIRARWFHQSILHRRY